MRKIYLIVGQMNSIDYSYHWNYRAFTDADRAADCRNQLDAEMEKYRQTRNTLTGEWQHPLDSQVTLWPTAPGCPDVTYSVEVVDLAD